MGVIDYFKVMLLVQLFFSIGITGIAYTIPAEARHHISDYVSLSEKMDVNKVNADVKSTITKQKNIPIIELGALLFYSGNILLDFFLNFAFAIPEMIGLLVGGLFNIFAVDNQLSTMLIMFIEIGFSLLYFLSLIQLITSIRTGSRII